MQQSKADGAEIYELTNDGQGWDVLQWDRAFDGAEIYRTTGKLRPSSPASMGPRL